MRRWTILLAGAGVWLFLLAVPAFADGGPHIASVNNGTMGLTSDNCAGCHRAHTAQAEYLLKEEVPDLCLTCHGTGTLGATTDVEEGVQYAPATDGSRNTSTVLGALRAGGYLYAHIASGSAARVATASNSLRGKVPVASGGAAVTSKHMSITGGTVGATVWGNGADNSGAGGTTTLNCTSCHNPHGNGNYRILNPLPAGDGGTMTAATTPAPVTDGALGTADVNGRYPTRNYTVIAVKGTEGTDSSFLLYASQVQGTYSNTAGDYFHRSVPWNETVSANKMNDAPNGKPSTFNGQITTWCTQCHTRYLANDTTNIPQLTNSGDAIFAFRHGTSRTPCTTCHVAHGSNAQMTGFNSTHENVPGGGADPSATANPDSRLLKVDNRGTCQMCHDPTGTITVGTQVGPTPVPLVP